MNALKALKGGLLVSSQAPEGSPLRKPPVLAAMALAAAQGGAAGLRIDGPETISLVRRRTRLPIAGLWKAEGTITPDFARARRLAQAGADLIAVDATFRRGDIEGLFRRIHEELGLPVIADVSNPAEGRRARSFGADMLASTLSGYVGPMTAPKLPDLKLVGALARLGAPVLAEGRYALRSQVRRAFSLGAHCVCVGGAITRPDLLTRDLLP